MGDWFVSVDGQNTGPHPAEHVRHWLQVGQVPPTALLWPTDGSSGTSWLSVAQAWPQLHGAPAPQPTGPAVVTGSGQGVVTGSGQAVVTGSGQVVVTGPGQVVTGPGQVSPSQVSPAQVTPGAQPAYLPPGTGPVGTGTGGYPMSGFPAAAAAAAAAPNHPGWNPMQALADFAGVDRLEGFRPGELLSAVFRRYSREETERHFATGLPETTPEVHAIEPGWPKPWMFVRLLGMSSVLFVGFLVLIKLFDGGNLLPGLIVVGSFAVPLSVLVFFFEVNSPRNVSLYLVIHCLLIGGLISLAITLLLEQTVGRVDQSFFQTFVDPVLIGVAEEVGKLAAVFLITSRLPSVRYPWILNGMLFGAAVGAGFACFESAGYAFYSLFLPDQANPESVGPNLAESINTIVLRGALAPFGHVVWTALAAGALWRVKLASGLDVKMLLSQRVLRMLLIVVVLHALWDFDYTAKIPYYFGQLGLGVLAWLLAFGMLQNGLKQIKAAKAASPVGYLQVSGATQVLRTVGQVGT